MALSAPELDTGSLSGLNADVSPPTDDRPLLPDGRSRHVCASVFAVAIAVFFGISTAYWTGLAAYVLAASALALIVRAQAEAPVLGDREAREGVAAGA